MKFCKYCKTYHPVEFFHIAAKTEKKIYRRLKCKFCYYKTKEKLKSKYQGWVTDYKKRNSCYYCGIEDYRVLEFHHIQKKDFNISTALHYSHLSLSRIKEEVKKCIVVCANCHRIIHCKKHSGV